jgi:hypothetical protein
MSGWFDLKRAAAYTSLSVRKLQDYLKDPLRPLPARLVGGKWLIAQDDLDGWLRSFPRAGEDLDRLVDEVMEEFKGAKYEQKR